MPPRYAYWVIILDGAATSFRARTREELLPTFNRLRTKDSAAVMKWFERGKLFDSPTLAREDRLKEAGLWEDRDRGSGTGDRFRTEDKRQKTGDRGGRPSGNRRTATGERTRPGRTGHTTGGPWHDTGDRAKGAFQRPGPGRPPGRRPERGRTPPPDENQPGKGERRGKDWRPGGEHRDPRDKYKGQPGERRKRWKERFFAKRGGPGDAGSKKR